MFSLMTSFLFSTVWKRSWSHSDTSWWKNISWVWSSLCFNIKCRENIQTTPKYRSQRNKHTLMSCPLTHTHTLFLLNAAQKLIVGFYPQLYSEYLQKSHLQLLDMCWWVRARSGRWRSSVCLCVNCGYGAGDTVCGLVTALRAWRCSSASLYAQLMQHPQTLGSSRDEKVTVIKPIVP